MGKVNGSSGIVVVDDLAEQETPLLTQISRCAYSNIIAVITAAFIVALWNSHASGSSPNGAVTPKQDRYLLHDSRITDNINHNIKSKTGSNNSDLNGHKKSLKFYTKNSKLYSSTGNSQNTQEKHTLADTPPEKSVLFERGRGGYNNYRIPSLIVTKSGTLLAFCEGREAGDAGDIDILLRRSEDGGKSWSPKQVVWSDARNTCGNPCPVVDRDTGRIWLMTTWNLGTDDEGGTKHSDDTIIFEAISMESLSSSFKSHDSEPAAKQMLLRKKYLNLPVEYGAAMTQIDILIDGDIAYRFEIALAGNKVDFWIPLDISEYKGKKAKFLPTPQDTPKSAFDRLFQSDVPKEADSYYKEKNRQQFHFSTQRGWTNDTNGMVYYDGEYHLFFQHTPFALRPGRVKNIIVYELDSIWH